MSSSENRPEPTRRITSADRRRLDLARRMVERMTVPERIAQLHQHSPGVERLGIRPFVTGTEGVHGLAWQGEATQFPQPVGMAASWDPGLLREAATVVAAEVREMHAADPRVSLSVWAPVVNPLRHPLWGRTEEGYTEDPLLNSILACGFAAGLKGDGDTWDTLPTLKHFLAYSNETDRVATSSELSPRVLHEYELPAYVEPVAQGVAASVMLSYNLVNGRPAHLTDLLETHLRARTADPDLLFVVSDAGAPANLFRSQKVTPDAVTAYAAMLRAGVDSFTDNDTDPTETIDALTRALETGLIDQEHIDRAVVRQLVARARTGEFDDRASGARDDRGASADGASTRHERRALSREVATRSAVLLSRSEETSLPLRSGRVAVIGEQAHTVLRDWYSGPFHHSTSLVEALRDHEAGTDMITTRALDRIGLEVVAAGSEPGVPGGAVDPDPVVLAADSSLRCVRPAADVPRNSLPGPAAFEVLDLGEDVVALRETTTGRMVTPDDHGQLTATAERIDGWVVQETFRRHIAADGTWQLQHSGSGRFVGVEHHSGALVLRSAIADSGAGFSARVLETAEDAFDAAADGADTVVLVIGNDPHVHGRETEDRPHVRLPGPDRVAAERLAALPAGVATVLVLTSSYPYDLDGLEERIGAVIWSSHAGEAEGEALADLLTGRRDFSGRLAQSWPDSGPLPPLLDYDVIGTGATYLYGQGARFDFGHGLAIDRVAWSGTDVAADEDALRVQVTLTAPAHRVTAGPLHEVVQVYADVPAESFSRRRYVVPCTRLIGFEVIEVDSTGTTATLEIPYERLSLYAPDREGRELPDGPLTVRIARSSTETVAARELRIPGCHREQNPPPAVPEGTVPAHRAEETDGLSRSAATLLEGTELRPTTTSPGTADLVLEAGTVVTAVETRGLTTGAVDADPGDAELVDPRSSEPSAATALPLPHRVPPDAGQHTGRVRVRLSGPRALTGLRVEHP